MSVFRVEKNKGYTVMSNHHLRNHTLSLKAKGLLSQMLSLPDDWDYTLQGLAQINKESIDAIREAVRKLERAGYIKRSRERDERGCLRGTVYTIYEQPHAEPTPEEPTQEKPALDNPTLEKPMLDKPTLENPTQLNTESTKKRKRQSKDSSITDSIPFPSGFPDVTAQKRTEAKESFERYRDLILENIDYDVLASDPHVDREQLDEIVDLLQETVCSTRSRIRVAGNDYPAEVVRSKLLKLNSEHIRFVMDCLKQNTTQIRNIRQYLLAMLFNAPSTMNSYYTALVAHDTDVHTLLAQNLFHDGVEIAMAAAHLINDAAAFVLNFACQLHAPSVIAFENLEIELWHDGVGAADAAGRADGKTRDQLLVRTVEYDELALGRIKPHLDIHTSEIQRIADYGISQGKEQLNDL